MRCSCATRENGAQTASAALAKSGLVRDLGQSVLRKGERDSRVRGKCQLGMVADEDVVAEAAHDFVIPGSPYDDVN